MDIPEINRCHFCNRIAEFNYDDLPICNRCMVEHGGDEWDLISVGSIYVVASARNRDTRQNAELVTTGTFDEMWQLSLSLYTGEDTDG